MNNLFVFAGAKDLESNSNHSKLMEFRKLDSDINYWQETKEYKELFHSLEYTLMLVRAKSLLRQLDLIN